MSSNPYTGAAAMADRSPACRKTARQQPRTPGRVRCCTSLRPSWSRFTASLLAGSVSIGGRNGKTSPFHETLGRDIVEQSKPGPWWQKLGLAAAEMAVYVDWPAEFRRKLVAELTRSLARFTAVSEADKEGRSDPRPAEQWRQFLFFLAHGRLPWWAAKPTRTWNDVFGRWCSIGWPRVAFARPAAARSSYVI